MAFQPEIGKSLFKNYFNIEPETINALPRSGSARQYVRFSHGIHSALVVFNLNNYENEAFFSFTNHFINCKIRVPKILAIHSDRQHYLIEDLGPVSLYDVTIPLKGQLTNTVKNLYSTVLTDLIQIQVKAGANIDYALCYPVQSFDRQAIMWDLNYFKYNFLKLAGVDFDEYRLEKDFETLADYLTHNQLEGFMFRDFQSRNILLKDNEPYYIDYQGGRRGPLLYDVASLLYQARAQFSEALRDELFEVYLEELQKYYAFNKHLIYKQFKKFALIRTLQVLGAYGFRGFFEKKPHFIDSIPFAIQNLSQLIHSGSIEISLPSITEISHQLNITQIKVSDPEILTILVYSFSYRKGIPGDPSGNGGGFVFDCRGVNNPGQFAEYQHLTGKDQPVIDFFKDKSRIDTFLHDIIQTVTPSIDTYLQRGFKHLMVSFGCTGGQHRSVYCAQNFAEYVHNNFPVKVILCHREQNQMVTYENKMPEKRL